MALGGFTLEGLVSAQAGSGRNWAIDDDGGGRDDCDARGGGEARSKNGDCCKNRNRTHERVSRAILSAIKSSPPSSIIHRKIKK